jgi:hypothetical protein
MSHQIAFSVVDALCDRSFSVLGNVFLATRSTPAAARSFAPSRCASSSAWKVESRPAD